MSSSVKSSETQLPSHENVNTLFYLIALILDSKIVKGFRVAKIIKEYKFERVWGELESKKCFQKQ